MKREHGATLPYARHPAAPASPPSAGRRYGDAELRARSAAALHPTAWQSSSAAPAWHSSSPGAACAALTALGGGHLPPAAHDSGSGGNSCSNSGLGGSGGSNASTAGVQVKLEVDADMLETSSAPDEWPFEDLPMLPPFSTAAAAAPARRPAIGLSAGQLPALPAGQGMAWGLPTNPLQFGVRPAVAPMAAPMPWGGHFHHPHQAGHLMASCHHVPPAPARPPLVMAPHVRAMLIAHAAAAGIGPPAATGAGPPSGRAAALRRPTVPPAAVPSSAASAAPSGSSAAPALPLGMMPTPACAARCALSMRHAEGVAAFGAMTVDASGRMAEEGGPLGAAVLLSVFQEGGGGGGQGTAPPLGLSLKKSMSFADLINSHLQQQQTPLSF